MENKDAEIRFRVQPSIRDKIANNAGINGESIANYVRRIVMEELRKKESQRKAA
jgi:uncharacterized protein (DUF1778 family)